MQPVALRRQLTLQYVLALVLVALLATTSFGVLTWVMSAQEADAPTMNASGRQRMLSQRVSLMALRLASAESPAERHAVGRLLDQAIEEMESSHQGLLHGDDALGLQARRSPRVEALYFTPTHLDDRVRTYLADARTLRGLPAEQLDPHHPLLKSMLARSQEPLLRDLEDAAKAYEAEGTTHVSLLQSSQLALLVLTLALLLAEGALLFRPLVDRVVRMVDELRDHEARMRAQQESLRLVLDSTADGLLPIDAEGCVRQGSSVRITDWFGPPEIGAPFWHLLAGDDTFLATRLEMAFGQVTSGFLPAELALSQMPTRILKGGVHFDLDYQPITGAGGFLVKVRDVTAELEAERDRKQAMELQNILLRAIRARATYDAFIEETDRLLRQAMDDIPHADRLRVLHTLKGNTAIFGFQSLSERMHEAESTLLENPDIDVPTLVVDLQRAWQANLDRVAEHLDKGEPVVWLTAAEHASHVKALAEETPYRQ
ncbi:MAG: type IV pili methyl-accepting chemotaxis transducer N-terminal domain-containing protein, partial [Myxococcota bacterium]